MLAAEGRHGPVIHAVTEAAAQAGASVGARVVDARALAPELVVQPADLAGDAAALTRLAHWARRWCPWSATDGVDGLVLDTTGAAHLWGGEAAMLADMEARLADLGQTARLAVAPTHGAAWALARYGDAREVSAPSALRARLAMLPVAALRLDGQTRQTLRRLGLKRAGDLMALPRAALDRRFGHEGKLLATPLRRIDQALGHLPEPVVSPAPPQRFRAVQRLPEPVMDPQPWLSDLFAVLCADLARAGQGVREIRLELYRVDGQASRFQAVTARATRDADHLHRLLERRFETLDAGFGFDTLALEAIRWEPQEASQAGLDGADGAEVALATLIDRLTGRIGAAVRSPDPESSHLPERTARWGCARVPEPPCRPALTRLPAAASGLAGAPSAAPHRSPKPGLLLADRLAPAGLGGGGLVAPARIRPLRLLRAPERIEVLYTVPEGPPIRFRWRRKPFLIQRHQGPERIAPEWWQAPASARLRDYYKVEVADGARFWLFREGVAGDGRGGPPNWFLHGLFS
ncbi:protein ImuB [Jannaschia seohaensis]|uniref:Protein ImuB n=1 Tax=Jannaschia seohaensis TaxID=475081 RepID=A0A2Y9C8T4_9RHOB|nr:protein ImuB [Jannaschia seohaensis]SSA50203.1 protein ImuB [Jannaschia seohaensis]